MSDSPVALRPITRQTTTPISNRGACSSAGLSLPTSAPSRRRPTITSIGISTWDNTDIRYAKATNLFGNETIFGVSLPNNPTVTDVWNSTPAWGYPFLSSELAPAQTGTLIEGGLAQQVAGLTAYSFVNARLVYAEMGAYRTLSSTGRLGPRRDHRWRGDQGACSLLAACGRNAKWGRNSFEIGTRGGRSRSNSARMTGLGTDHTIDVGFDTQYQFLADRNSVSVQASWITENDTFTASANPAIGAASNTHDHLRSLRLKSSYWYDQTYGLTLGFFHLDGSNDANLYGGLPSANGSPNSQGWTSEVDFVPFNHGGPAFWPWLNVKLGLQYVYYTKFNGAASNYDGAGRNAQDNNTLFLFAWLAF